MLLAFYFKKVFKFIYEKYVNLGGNLKALWNYFVIAIT
jgi:hypothetical protein